MGEYGAVSNTPHLAPSSLNAVGITAGPHVVTVVSIEQRKCTCSKKKYMYII